MGPGVSWSHLRDELSADSPNQILTWGGGPITSFYSSTGDISEDENLF